MNLHKIIAAALSLSFVVGATTNFNNYAPINSVTVSAEGETAVTTTTAAITTTAVTTTTLTATTTKAAATTTKAVVTTTAKATTSTAATTKASVTSTTATVTTTAKPVTSSTTLASSTTVVASVTTTGTTTAPVAQDYTLGDVNNDGHINAVDASSVLSYYAMISTNKNGDFDDKQKAAADVNNDGSINAVDASCILSYYAYVSTTKDGAMSIAEFLKNGEKTTLQFAPSNPLMNAYSALQIGYADNNDANSVTSDLKLCNELEGAKITWSSDKPDVIATNGSVTRSNETKNVKLTATIRSNEESLDKEFEVRVIKNTYDNYNTDYLYDMENLEHLYIYNDDEDALKVYLNDDGYIKDLNGKFSKIIVESPEEALLTLYEVKSLMGCDDPKTQLVWYQTSNSKYSYSYKFRQIVDGIPVYGKSIVVSTDLEGNTTSLHSPFISKLKVNTNNILSEAQIKAAIEKEGYSLSYVDGKYIYPINDDMVVVYKVHVSLDSKGYDMIVDAHTGETIVKEEIGNFLSQKASGNDAFGNPIEIDVNVLYEGANLTYTLDDLSRNIQFHDVSRYIGTDFESGISNEILANSHIVKERNEWSPEEISASINVKRVYDFYNEILGRKGFDNKNSLFHMCINWWDENSFGNGNLICFGHGDIPMAAGLDGVGHEFTHCVVDNETNIGKKGEPALTVNEAYADILGILAEAYSYGTEPDWVMADDVIKNNTPELHERNIKDPHDLINIDNVKNRENEEVIKQIPMPMSINDENYFNWRSNYNYKLGKDDGAHHNSTIISYPCYLMWKNGIQDTQKLAELWYTSLTYGYDVYPELSDEQDGGSDDAEIHLKRSLEYFRNVRNNVLRAAESMRMSSDEYRIIEAAFDEAGITADEPVDIKGTNAILGKIVEADLDTQIDNNKPVEDAEIVLKREKSKKSITVKSGSDGTFSIYNLRPGKYSIDISRLGYNQTTVDIELKDKDEEHTCHLDAIELIPDKYQGFGVASGIITDSVTGAGVDGLELTACWGMNAHDGNTINKTITSDGGKYKLELTTGVYCVKIVDKRAVSDGQSKYKTTYFNIKVFGEETIPNQNATVELEKQNKPNKERFDDPIYSMPGGITVAFSPLDTGTNSDPRMIDILNKLNSGLDDSEKIVYNVFSGTVRIQVEPKYTYDDQEYGIYNSFNDILSCAKSIDNTFELFNANKKYSIVKYAYVNSQDHNQPKTMFENEQWYTHVYEHATQENDKHNIACALGSSDIGYTNRLSIGKNSSNIYIIKDDYYYRDYWVETLYGYYNNYSTRKFVANYFDNHKYNGYSNIEYVIDLRSIDGYDRNLDTICRESGGKYIKYTEEGLDKLITLINDRRAYDDSKT